MDYKYIPFPSPAASPPKFVSMDEIMKAAQGVSNLALAHEIAVDSDFSINPAKPPEDRYGTKAHTTGKLKSCRLSQGSCTASENHLSMLLLAVIAYRQKKLAQKYAHQLFLITKNSDIVV